MSLSISPNRLARLVLPCASALWLALLAEPCSAYVQAVGATLRRPVRWRDGAVTLTLARKQLPVELDPAAVLEAARRAAGRWNTATKCAHVELRIADATEINTVEDDGVNVIAFRRTSWCRDGLKRSGQCYGAEQVARTTLHDTVAGDAEFIAGADIELNAVGFDFGAKTYTPDGAEPGRRRAPADLEVVLIHEFGHVLGFEHPCRSGGGSTRATRDDHGVPLGPCMAGDPALQSVMFPGWQATNAPPRGLGPEDERALCAVYALEKPAAPQRSGCALTTPGDASGAWFVAAVLAGFAVIRLRQRLATRVTAADGERASS